MIANAADDVLAARHLSSMTRHEECERQAGSESGRETTDPDETQNTEKEHIWANQATKALLKQKTTIHNQIFMARKSHQAYGLRGVSFFIIDVSKSINLSHRL